MPNPSAVYREALLEARSRGFALGRASVLQMLEGYAAAIAGIEKDVSEKAITPERATVLRRQLDGAIESITALVNRVTQDGMDFTIAAVVDAHEQAVAFLAERYGQAGLAVRFDRVPAQTVAVLNARRENAANFRTLVKLHAEDAVADVDRLLTSAVARGVSSKRLTDDLVKLLEGRGSAVREQDYGLAGELTDAKSLRANMRMIAVSEINNALRESNAQALVANGMVLAAQWTLSGNHPDEDACDGLARSDFYGFGPGYYDPRVWPIAPHPHCGCYQGDVLMRPVSEWTSARGAVRPILGEPDVYRLKGLTDRALEVQTNLVHAIVRAAHGTGVRRAA
jgi:ABC-type amino acid transport substrate-binding protein